MFTLDGCCQSASQCAVGSTRRLLVLCGVLLDGARLSVSDGIVVVGVAGTLALIADGVILTAVWLRRNWGGPPANTMHRYALGSTLEADSVPVRRNEGLSRVCEYWEELQHAILESPRTLPGTLSRPLCSSSHMHCSFMADALPEALRLIWEDRVRYVVDIGEIASRLRQVDEVDPRDVKAAVSAASLALLWRVQLISSLHSAVAVSLNSDRGDSLLRDLNTCSGKFFCTFVNGLVQPLREGFSECWEALTVEEKRLREEIRMLKLRNVFCLARYIFSRGAGKIVLCGMMVGVTAVGTQSARAGIIVRDSVERLLTSLFSSTAPTGYSTSAKVSSSAVMKSVMGLLALECLRLTVTITIMHLATEHIRTAASHHRDCMKQQLYRSLTCLPLSYFDMTEADEIERLLYYVNDLEGVDVYIHNFLTCVVRTGTSAVAAVAALDTNSAAVVLATVVMSSLLSSALTALRRRFSTAVSRGRFSTGAVCHSSGEHGDSLGDAEEAENGCSVTDQIMLRGMEIIEHIRELRPYAADATLMSWWICHTAPYREGRYNVWNALRFTGYFGPLWIIDALRSVVKWFLPALVASHATASCQRQAVLLEAVRAMEDVLERTSDVQDVLDIVVHNAYKAAVLERLLDPRNQEEGEHTTEDKISQAEEVGIEVCAIRAENLQFQYPSAPTVDAFVRPVSFCVRFQDEVSGIGRLVCVTGPSGCGKSTLLRLLLALYTPANSGTLMMQFQPCLSPSSNSSEVIKEGKAGGSVDRWVSVCTFHRRKLRSQFFAYVPQVPTLFQGSTIVQNVSLQNRVSLTDTALIARVRTCIEAAGCSDFVRRLPQGLFTTLAGQTGWSTPGTVRLSHGQGQRLMLARALFHGGRILLLDEPTSGLDNETKASVMRQWRALLESRQLSGVLCVTHDNDVLQAADEIVRL
ncbi:putative ABC transporter [Trypanosoma vivax]|nr:putative ABC transporter [Trypanosoma vivax]